MFRVRHTARLAAAALLSAALLVGASGASHAASCTNPPDGQRQYWAISNITKDRARTGLASNWVHPNHGPKTITYSRSATASTTATAGFATTAEAGVIFAKASAQISVSVAKSWSKTDTWSYSTTVAKNPAYQYRLVQFQETRRFTASLKRWQLSNGRCAYVTVKSGRAMMPRTATSSLVWTTERRAA